MRHYTPADRDATPCGLDYLHRDPADDTDDARYVQCRKCQNHLIRTGRVTGDYRYTHWLKR